MLKINVYMVDRVFFTKGDFDQSKIVHTSGYVPDSEHQQQKLGSGQGLELKASGVPLPADAHIRGDRSSPDGKPALVRPQCS